MEVVIPAPATKVSGPLSAGPAGTAAPRAESPAVVTGLLVAAQLLAWVAVAFFYRNNDWADFALLPRSFTLPRLLAAPFLHVHPYHLGFNVALLWLFGSRLERAIGPARFFLLYLGGAAFSGLMYWAVATAAQLYLSPEAARAGMGALGSSGAIAGILGVYTVRLPHRPLRIPVAGWRIPPAGLMAVWLAWEFGHAILWTARGEGSGVGHWAHVAGFVFGLGAGQALRLHAPARREQLEEAAAAATARQDWPEAAEHWTALLTGDPRADGARLALVRTRLAQGDTDAAEGTAQEGLAQAARGGEVARSIEMYRTYTELLPGLRLPSGVRYRIGCWLADAGEDRAALAALLEAAREEQGTPAAASALFRAGEVAADRLHDSRRARQAWQRILMDYGESAWRDLAFQRLSALGRGGQG